AALDGLAVGAAVARAEQRIALVLSVFALGLFPGHLHTLAEAKPGQCKVEAREQRERGQDLGKTSAQAAEQRAELRARRGAHEPREARRLGPEGPPQR